MRIKNLTSNASNMGIFCMLALFLVFAAIDIVILAIALNSGMTLGESFAWMFSSFCEADLEMKLVYLVLLIFPFLWLFLLVNEIRIRLSDDIIAYNSETFIKYIDFTDDKIILSYLKTKGTKEIYYKDIDSIELVIDIGVTIYSKYDLYINIQSGPYTFSIHHAPVDFNKFYKVIYYSQYMKDFSYRFIGIGSLKKETLEQSIDNFIANGYIMPQHIKLNSPASPVLPIILFVALFCGFIVFFISLFNSY